MPPVTEITTAVTADDITGTWAGLRPLVKTATSAGTGKTADLSRRHAVTVSGRGVISVTGGKLTTYRQMSQDAVDTAMERLGRKGRSHTKRLRLRGAGRRWGHSPATSTAGHLAGRYGSDLGWLERLIANDASLLNPLIPGHPHVRAEAVHAVTDEMARSLDDVLSRRTRLRLYDRAGTVEHAQSVAELIAPALGWDDEEIDRQVTAYRDSVMHEIASETSTGAET